MAYIIPVLYNDGMDMVLDRCKHALRAVVRQFARGLNRVTRGHIHPNTVTLIGLAMHIPIALAIAANMRITAALLLVIFGLFDTLDGELARLQHRASTAGMLLDSTTDRMKEVILYMGVATNFIIAEQPWFCVWAVAAVGGSLLVSYVNAWGEVVLAQKPASKHAVNQTFRGGLMRFEVRMVFLIIGLLSNQLAITVVIIAVLVWITAFQRLVGIYRRVQA